MNHPDKQKHLKHLANAFVDELIIDGENCIGLDSKRPFGNSNIALDVCEIIGLSCSKCHGSPCDDCRDYAMSLLLVDLKPYLREKIMVTP